MGEFDYGPDCLYFPLVIDSTNKKLTIKEFDSDNNVLQQDTISLDENRYWNHNTDATNSPDLQDGLLHHIKEKMNGSPSLNGSYAITPVTPTGSEITNSGIIIFNGVTTFDHFGLDFTPGGSAATTFPPEYLGFSTETDLATSGTGGQTLYSPFSVYGQYRPWNVIDGIATKKKRDPMRLVASSSDDASHARGQVLGEFDVRPFEFQSVYGGVVYKNRAHDQGSAKVARLPWYDSNSIPFDDTGSSTPYGDVHNAFEDLYVAMTTPGEGNLFSKIVVLYDEADTSDGMDWGSHEVERCRIRMNGEQDGNWNSYITQQRMQGDYYQVKFELQIIDDWGYRQ